MADATVTGPPPAGLVAAQRLARDALDEVMAQPLAGLSEVEIAERIEERLAARGVTETWCPTLVGVGNGTLVCHPDHHPTRERIVRPGGLLWADVTPVLDGWFGDATQVWFAGESGAGEAEDEADARLRGDALAIEQAGLAYVEPGMEARDLFHYVKRLMDDAGYELLDLLGNVGHDIGTSAYSKGFIDPTNATPMWGGWTMEPHLGDGRHGAKFEDVVWLSETDKVLL